ncbi:MAG: TonB-dependent vitamin B12 receptor [Thermomonas sp.]|uniref:TonB-dependent vitamin B12 receptor n=1 Tax=Thermomonas sp. TaxID=1971895 RepID=UPI0039E46E35
MKARSLPLRRSLLALALAVPAIATAQSHDDAKTLDNLIVTGTRTEVALEDSLVPAQVIDRAEIERSQANSLQGLLRGRAGINLTNSGGLGKQTSLFMRGTNSAHTLVLVDGVRVNTADFGAATLQDIPLAQIERIEIVRGPQSSLYGADAIGGVIQIFTRRDHGGFKPHASLGGGSNGLREAGAGFGGGGAHGWFGADYAYQRSEGINACRGYYDPATWAGAGCYANEPDRDGYHNRSLSLRGGYALTDALRVDASALAIEGDNEYDGYYNQSEIRQRVLGGKLRYAPSERFTLAVGIGRADNESDNRGAFATGSAQTHRDSASVQADFGIATGHLLSAGIDWSDDSLDGSSSGYAVEDRSNTGVFAQYQGRFGKQSLQASLRNDDNEQFGNHSTGSLVWGINFGDGFKLTAGYGTAFKAPTFSDLYDPWSGVPTLRPEESRSANVGLAWQGEGWRWGLDAYQTRIDDLITYDSTTWMMAQVEKARITGAELTGGIDLAGWDLSVQLSHTDPRNRTGGSSQYDNLLARRARNTGRIDLQRSFGTFDFGATLNGAGSRFDDAANAVRLGGYATFDTRLSWRFAPGWTLQANVANLFDREYETVAWYNQAGREFALRLRWQPE